jgi:hypothetical protein
MSSKEIFEMLCGAVLGSSSGVGADLGESVKNDKEL